MGQRVILAREAVYPAIALYRAAKKTVALAYNPRQPRDKFGKWATTPGADLVPARHEADIGSRLMTDDLPHGNSTSFYGDAVDLHAKPWKITMENREAVKRKLAQEIGSEMFDYMYPHPTKKQLADKAAQVENLRSWADTLTRSWAASSGDNHHESIALQIAIDAHLGLDDAFTDHLGRNHDGTTNDEAIDKAIAYHDRHEKIMDAYVAVVYSRTQSYLKKKGITHLTLYRGMEDDGNGMPELKDGQEAVINMQPASSFATHPQIARRFSAGAAATMIAVRVPANRIFSTSRTGLGCLSELEVAVIGGPIRAKVYKKKHTKIGTWGGKPDYQATEQTDQFHARVFAALGFTPTDDYD